MTTTRLFLTGITTSGRHGANAGEKDVPQDFVVDLDVDAQGEGRGTFPMPGIVSIATSKRNGDVVASFPVGDKDQVMMITDAGRLIRIPIGDVRVAGRATQGVTLFATGEEEHVTSVAHLPQEETEGEGADVQEETAAEA